ncbi:MAG: hypothetical protein WCP29_00705 [Acidobacteriota bacterium]
MTDLSQFHKLGTASLTDYYCADSDILLVIPQSGMVDTPQLAREHVDYQNAYARALGKPCSTLVVLSNLLSQDAESRRIYGEMGGTGLYFASALVVDNLLSRALGSFFIGLSKPRIPVKLFDTIEHGIAWLRSIRPV